MRHGVAAGTGTHSSATRLNPLKKPRGDEE